MELLLQSDGVRADDGFAFILEGFEEGGDEIGKAFADSCACFDDEMMPFCECFCYGFGHGFLLRAVLKFFDRREGPVAIKELTDLLGERLHNGRGKLLWRIVLSSGGKVWKKGFRLGSLNFVFSLR